MGRPKVAHPKKPLSFRISKEDDEFLKFYAKKKDISQGEVLSLALHKLKEYYEGGGKRNE